MVLAVALTGLLWERLEAIPYSLRAIPIGVLVLSVLFAVYTPVYSVIITACTIFGPSGSAVSAP